MSFILWRQQVFTLVAGVARAVGLRRRLWLLELRRAGWVPNRVLESDSRRELVTPDTTAKVHK